jgi:hypothetical protein
MTICPVLCSPSITEHTSHSFLHDKFTQLDGKDIRNSTTSMGSNKERISYISPLNQLTTLKDKLQMLITEVIPGSLEEL